MVKLRKAGYCNLKLFALYITIYAHMIEPQIWSDPGLYKIYQLIYLFHMPMFAFLSGLFLQNARSCLKQSLRALLLYIAAQGVYLLLEANVRWDTPYWHLWYLLSLSIWSLLGGLWFWRKGRWGLLLLLVWVFLGCIAGKYSFIDRRFSVSRTLVFLPYFWAGLLLRRPVSRHGVAGWMFLGLGLLGAYFLCKEVTVSFLWQAAPYGENGSALRLGCYAVGGLLCAGFVCLRVEKRLAVSRAGADTLWAYLLHAPLVRWLWDFSLSPWVLALLAAGYVWLIYVLGKWHGCLYGIVPEGRRDRNCQHLPRFMKPMQDPYIDSCSP